MASLLKSKMEAMVEEIVSVEDLKKFEQTYNGELARGQVGGRTQFNYAWCLIRSRYTNDIKKGVFLLEELLHGGNPQVQRDCLFYLGIGYYRLKDYTKALKYVSGIQQLEPNNTQAKDLKQLIRKKMNREGLMGMAIVGGAVLAVGGLVGAGIALSKK